jgi:CDP-glycerol glycerophosphotransferase
VADDDEIRAVTLYATKPHGNFTLDIGERKHEVPPHLNVTSVRWAPGAPTELEFTGRCTLAAFPDGALAVHLEDGAGGSAVFPARACPQAGGDFVVRVPVTELPAGLWTGQLRLGAWSWSLPPVPDDLTPAKWRRRGLPWYAKPMTDQGEEFGLHVARTHLPRAVTRRLKS